MHATGDYDTTKELLNRAVKFVGADTRRGGEYKLWLAQALQGAGDNDGCVAVLKSMKDHSDRDVKVVANELLYIASAPKLKLGQDDFVAWRKSATAVSESFNRKDYKRLNKPKAPY
eukprot:11747-Heterococcus_DN1.PRE.1